MSVITFTSVRSWYINTNVAATSIVYKTFVSIWILTQINKVSTESPTWHNNTLSYIFLDVLDTIVDYLDWSLLYFRSFLQMLHVLYGSRQYINLIWISCLVVHSDEHVGKPVNSEQNLTTERCSWILNCKTQGTYRVHRTFLVWIYLP